MITPPEAIDRIIEQREALFQKLRSITNEVSGVWGCYELELRQIMGNTNYNCVQLRIDDAKSALEIKAP